MYTIQSHLKIFVIITKEIMTVAWSQITRYLIVWYFSHVTFLSVDVKVDYGTSK